MPTPRRRFAPLLALLFAAIAGIAIGRLIAPPPPAGFPPPVLPPQVATTLEVALSGTLPVELTAHTGAIDLVGTLEVTGTTTIALTGETLIVPPPKPPEKPPEIDEDEESRNGRRPG
jgi:hypothetical protein